jgi:4-oxalocrotonate tautomerase
VDHLTPRERNATVPYIEVKALERRIDDASAKRVIAALTDALCDALGEEVRPDTWVVVEGVPATRWGIAGEPLS